MSALSSTMSTRATGRHLSRGFGSVRRFRVPVSSGSGGLNSRTVTEPGYESSAYSRCPDACRVRADPGVRARSRGRSPHGHYRAVGGHARGSSPWAGDADGRRVCRRAHVVLAIGAALALTFGWVLPTAFESGAERLGGALLIVLGAGRLLGRDLGPRVRSLAPGNRRSDALALPLRPVDASTRTHTRACRRSWARCLPPAACAR